MRYKVNIQITSETPDAPKPAVLNTNRLKEFETYNEAVDYVRHVQNLVKDSAALPEYSRLLSGFISHGCPLTPEQAKALGEFEGDGSIKVTK